MFAKRAHHSLPRPVGLPPRYLRASATTFDEVKLEAIAPPAGVTVAFDAALAPVATPASGATLALALASPRACICATPRSQRDVCSTCRSRAPRRPMRSARASVAMLGEPKPPDATIWGLLSMKLGLVLAKPPVCIGGALRSPRDTLIAWRWWR